MIILLDGAATVRTVDAMRASILDAFAQGTDVEIDLSAITEVDLSLFQLIEAARVHAAREGKTLRLAAPANAAVVALLHRAGCLTEPTPEDIAFWCHGEVLQ